MTRLSTISYLSIGTEPYGLFRRLCALSGAEWTNDSDDPRDWWVDGDTEDTMFLWNLDGTCLKGLPINKSTSLPYCNGYILFKSALNEGTVMGTLLAYYSLGNLVITLCGLLNKRHAILIARTYDHRGYPYGPDQEEDIIRARDPGAVILKMVPHEA